MSRSTGGDVSFPRHGRTASTTRLLAASALLLSFYIARFLEQHNGRTAAWGPSQQLSLPLSLISQAEAAEARINTSIAGHIQPTDGRTD